MKRQKENVFTLLLILLILICTIALILLGYQSLQQNKEFEIAKEDNKNENKREDVVVENEVKSYEVITPIIQEKENKQVIQSKDNRYYYGQLDNYAKLIYEAVESNMDKMKNGVEKITLPSKLSDLLDQEEGEKRLNATFQSAWDALIMDHVDYFFLDMQKISLITQKTVYRNKTTYEFSLEKGEHENYLKSSYASKEEVERIIQQAEERRKEILSNIQGSDYEKIVQVHDWIIEHLEYDTTQVGENSYNICGGLFEGKAVCEGYAKTFKYVLDEMQIPCILVSGTATNSENKTERHQWNYVLLENKWYAVDTTWDDPIIRGFGIVTNRIKHQYLLRGSQTMEKDHMPSGKISATGMTFQYPIIEIEDYKK